MTDLLTLIGSAVGYRTVRVPLPPASWLEWRREFERWMVIISDGHIVITSLRFEDNTRAVINLSDPDSIDKIKQFLESHR